MEKDKENWEDLDSLFSCGIEDERSWWICLQSFYIPCQTKTQICRSRLGAWMESFSSLTATISSAADASMATPTRGFLQGKEWSQTMHHIKLNCRRKILRNLWKRSRESRLNRPGHPFHLPPVRLPSRLLIVIEQLKQNPYPSATPVSPTPLRETCPWPSQMLLLGWAGNRLISETL